MAFEQWCDKLDKVSLEAGFSRPITEQTGRDCWRGYYDDGETPESAFREDMSNA